jgi:hypothetical protein
MIRDTFIKLADARKDDSLVTKIRLKRIAIFRRLVSHLPKPLRILDVGGTELFWKKMGLAGSWKSATITRLCSLFPDQRNRGSFSKRVSGSFSGVVGIICRCPHLEECHPKCARTS